MVSTVSIESVLRKDILSGALEPAAKLRMAALKERYHVGHSPIREALSRLVGDGLVSFEPNRGFAVASMSFEDLEDIAVARIAIECEAVRRSIELGDDRWEANLVAAIYHYRQKARTRFRDEDELERWESAHDGFHTALISACASPRLLNLQARLQEQHKRYRRLIIVEEFPKRVHIEEHEYLADLALSRKSDEAAAQLKGHMMITVDALRGSSLWNNQ